MLSLLMLGLSTSFTMALVARVLGGALNGNIGRIPNRYVGRLTT